MSDKQRELRDVPDDQAVIRNSNLASWSVDVNVGPKLAQVELTYISPGIYRLLVNGQDLSMLVSRLELELDGNNPALVTIEMPAEVTASLLAELGLAEEQQPASASEV